jgi:predicted O-methyltransferase YrrM
MDANYSEQTPSHYEYVMVDREQNAKIKEQAYEYMDQLVGWCSKEKAGVLIDLILKNRPKVIVEIGVWGGKSLIPMATALRANGLGKIYGIDPWDSAESIKEVMNESNLAHWSQADHRTVMYHLMSSIDRFGL